MVFAGREEETSITYEYFHDAIVGMNAAGNKMEFVQSISPRSSSNAIIDQLATVKNGIGYDGMAFNDPAKVKWLAVSKKTGEPSERPSADDARSRELPRWPARSTFTQSWRTGGATSKRSLTSL